LVGPPFPEIDYVSDEEGIATSINTETQKPQMDFGRNVVEVPGSTQTPVVEMEEKDRETLANSKFDLCCRQAGITCVGKYIYMLPLGASQFTPQRVSSSWE
jgi:hypothetical protein